MLVVIQQLNFEYFISEYSTRTRVTRNKRESESVEEGERECFQKNSSQYQRWEQARSAILMEFERIGNFMTEEKGVVCVCVCGGGGGGPSTYTL